MQWCTKSALLCDTLAQFASRYEQRAKSANTQQQMKDLQDQAQKEMVSAISHEGLSVQQYQNTIQMAQADFDVEAALDFCSSAIRGVTPGQYGT